MIKTSKLGIFIGRFQPFHKGHMHALRYSLSRCRKLVIGIGSSQESGTDRNPLSSSERVQIIKAALKGARIDMRRVKFLNIPDFNDNEKWFDYIIRKEPEIGVVFSRNRLVNRIFSDRGFETAPPVWHRRRVFKAASIRRMIKNGGSWEGRVPRGAIMEIALRKSKIKSSVTSATSKKRDRTNIVIGGTFGYLHSGHVALIRKAFEIGDFVYVGLTTDSYVKKIKPGEKIPSYAERKRRLVRLLVSFKKGYRVKPLDDKYGPAATGDFDAIVVSSETFPTALEINKMRRDNGLHALLVIKIGSVLGADSVPISTSRIARGEIDEEGNRI
jgi:nicotinamide-nucleotide adenylyltransferase